MVLLTGCFRSSLLPYVHDGPAQVLVPTALTGVVDGRARFREILCAVRDDHGRSLPDDRPCEKTLLRVGGEPAPTGRPVKLGPGDASLRVFVVPGLYAECIQDLTTIFADGLAHLVTHGYRASVMMVDGRSSSGHNATIIRNGIIATSSDADRLILIGHSKGAVDILEAVVGHADIVPRVAAIVSVAGAINGSPLADGLLDVHRALLQRTSLRGCGPGDGGAIASLFRAQRLTFLATNELPSSIRYFSVGGIVERRETSRLLRTSHRRLDDIDPRNDGQVLWTDAVIPRATLLGYVTADHWAIAMPFSRTAPELAATLIDHNAFPREVFLEAIVRTVQESLADH
jgi:hypothetical protein